MRWSRSSRRGPRLLSEEQAHYVETRVELRAKLGDAARQLATT